MINRVVLVGRLTRDVEVRKTNSGISVATFTVACDRPRSKDQNQQQTADFVSCIVWRQPADFLGQYARKGYMVGVDGRIQTRNYQDKDGRTVYITEVVAENVRILESREKNAAQPAMAPAATYANAPTLAPATDPYSGFDTGPDLGFSPDDLPF